MSNIVVFLISPSLEGVVDIQSSKQQLENPKIVVEARKENYTPSIGVTYVALVQVLDVPMVTQAPIIKVIPPPPHTSYVQELWESLTIGKNHVGVVSKTSKKVGVKGRIWKAWVQ